MAKITMVSVGLPAALVPKKAAIGDEEVGYIIRLTPSIGHTVILVGAHPGHTHIVAPPANSSSNRYRISGDCINQVTAVRSAFRYGILLIE